MSIYETPLQFGYFLALLFAVLLWVRSRETERLSDAMLGWVLFFLAMEIQDYTFGFSGINVLWEELNGFPRYFPWIFAASIYFYLKAQINRNFKLSKRDAWHLLPYLCYFFLHLAFFIQGETAVQTFQKSAKMWYLEHFETLMVWVSYGFYFTKSLKLYREYRAWTEQQFSNIERVSLVWLRNFIYLIIAGEAFKWAWHIADSALGDLPFEQDWWWHLFTVGIICYVAISGYAQPQPQELRYSPDFNIENNAQISFTENEATDTLTQTIDTEQNDATDSIFSKNIAVDLLLVKKIMKAIEEDQIFLSPDISLSEFATRLRTNTSVLSATINQHFGKNFNDFINYYRVIAFQEAIKKPSNQHLTLLAVALDCGFNSKATFNRAYKKVTGNAPSAKEN